MNCEPGSVQVEEERKLELGAERRVEEGGDRLHDGTKLVRFTP